MQIPERKPSEAVPGILRGVEVGLVGILAALLVWKGILPAWRTLNTDFPNYYLVARLIREHYSLDRVYDWIWLQRIKDHWGVPQSLVGFAALTPPSALTILPLSFFPALIAKRIWIVLNAGMLAISVELLYRSTRLRRRTVWAVCLLAIIPLRNSFLFGQMHLLVLMLLVMAWCAFQRRRDGLCGVCIALAASIKVYPVLMAGYFLFRRRWSAAFTTIAVVIAIFAATGWLTGKEMMHQFLFQQLPRTLQGEVMDPYSSTFASGASLFHRLLLPEPQLNPSPLIHSPALYSVLYPLWQISVGLPLVILLRPGRKTRSGEIVQAEWSALPLALLALTPVPSTYHFVVLLLPVVLLIDSMLRYGAWRSAMLACGLYAAIGLAGGVRFPIASSRFWLISALYALSLHWLLQILRQENELPSRRDLMVGVAMAACGFVASSVGYRHHFKDRDAQLAGRLQLQSPTLLATSPAATPDGVDYVAMVGQGYRVAHESLSHGDATARNLPGGDQLSFATTGSGLLIEIADSDGSRIVRSSDGEVVAQDAESPAVSEDGGALAYLRESNGRGRLYIKTLSSGTNLVRTDDSYDVRQAAFLADGSVLFTAAHNGGTHLYQVDATTLPREFADVRDDVGAFAISPDNRHLALTRLVKDRWQLALFDRASHTIELLTANDCNAYAPAWRGEDTIIYATDCGRGLGLTALAQLHIGKTPGPR